MASSSSRKTAGSFFDVSDKPAKRGRTDGAHADAEDAAAAQADQDDLEDVKSRKDAVKNEGYDSDSSDDGEGVVPSRKPGAKGAAGGGDDSDDDMFGDAKPKAAAAGAPSGKKKEDKFLSLGEIEGQEFGGGGDGDESDDSKDGMGYELSSFNMKSEMREGAFTEDGAYVTNAKDKLEVHDRWLDGVDSKEAMRQAREAKRRRDRDEQARAEREVEVLRDGHGTEEMTAQLVELMERGETVLEAMQRLGRAQSGQTVAEDKGGKRKTWAEKQKERKKALADAAAAAAAADAAMDTSDATSSTAAAIPATPFERLSTLTSELTSLGQLDLYSMSREALQRLLPPPPASSSSAPASASASSSSQAPSLAGPSQPGPPPGPPDDGSTYEYRYTMDYLKSMPEGERPVEREIFDPSRNRPSSSGARPDSSVASQGARSGSS